MTRAATAFEPLARAYQDRLALLRASSDSAPPVVGFVGNTVPLELILATGCIPMRIAPIDGDPGASDAYIESVSDLDVRRTFQLGVSGALKGLAALVIPRSTESQHKLYLSLREARRICIGAEQPPLWLYELLHTQRSSSRDYSLARSHELWQSLAALTGRRCDAGALRQAIESTNKRRRLLADLQAARWSGRVSGTEALQATGALAFVTPQAGLDALEVWMREVQARPAQVVRGLLLRGAPIDHPHVHVAAQACGADILAEDDDWGSRAAEPLIDEAADDPLAAVLDHYASAVPCVRRHPADDRWFLRALVRPEITGVLFHLPEPEDVQGWSFPHDRRVVEAAGKPWLLVRRNAEDLQALQDEVAAGMRAFKPATPVLAS